MTNRRAHHNGSVVKGYRRRAYVLLYILPLIPLLALVSVLLVRGTGAIVRSERVTLERTSDYAVLNDWLDEFRTDTRNAQKFAILSHEEEPETIVRLLSADSSVEYRFSGCEVMRLSGRGDVFEVTGQWILKGMTIAVSNETGELAEHLVNVNVRWKREHRHRPEAPTLLFETSFYVGRDYES